MKRSLNKILSKAKNEEVKNDLYQKNYFSLKKNNNLFYESLTPPKRQKSKSIQKKTFDNNIKSQKNITKDKSPLRESIRERSQFNKKKLLKSISKGVSKSRSKNKNIINQNIPKPEPQPEKVPKKISKKSVVVSQSKSPVNIKRHKTKSRNNTRKQILANLNKEKIFQTSKENNILKEKSKSKSNKKIFSKNKIQIKNSIEKNKNLPSVSKSKSKKRKSSQKIKVKRNSKQILTQDQFKLNLQDLIEIDEIYDFILQTKLEQNKGFNFSILKQYLINNYCFILKDLTLLFYDINFRKKMRTFFLKELLFFSYLMMLLMQTQAENATLDKQEIQINNKDQGEFYQRYQHNVNQEIYDVLKQIISNLHIVFLLRVEIFLDRAAIYYQNHKLYVKIKHLLSKRKSNYKLSMPTKNFDNHFFKIESYLNLTEKSLEELFKLNKSMLQFSHSLYESLIKIEARQGEIKYEEINMLLQYMNITFDSKGIQNFDERYLISLIFQSNSNQPYSIVGENQNNTVTEPYIQEQRDKDKQLTMIIDLDETLVFYPDEHLHVIETQLKQNLKIRPYAKQFLVQMNKYYELIIFTAASQEYADLVIDLIDPHNLVKHRLYRQHMSQHQNKLIKDLSKVGRDLKKSILIDNTPENFILQPENGVFVKSWHGEEEDKCFEILIPIFESIAKLEQSDIREVLKELRNLMVTNFNQILMQCYLIYEKKLHFIEKTINKEKLDSIKC